MGRRQLRSVARRLLLVPLLGAALGSALDGASGGSSSQSEKTYEVDEGNGNPSAESDECDPGMEERSWTIDGLPGKKYVAGVGIDVKGDRLTLTHESGTSLVSKCKNHYGPWDLIQLRLVEGSISFTVDLSGVGCSCNLAFYLVSAPARDVDGIPIAGNNTYAPGNYYCDANKVGGQWCPEIDIMEANNHAFQATPHKCDAPVGDRHYNHCDRAGCGQNTKYLNKAYGPGPDFGIDTTKPFRVETDFAGHDGKLSGMATILRQGGHQVVLDHSNCDPGYYAAVSQAMETGMSLRVTYWGDGPDMMAWMDKPPCGTQVCGDSAGPAVISNVVVKSSIAGPAVEPTEAAAPAQREARHVMNCSSGLSNWQKGWSPLKIAWCCENGGASCAASNQRKGPIKWSNHPNKCLTVARAAGSTTIKPSDYSLIVWDCQDGVVGDSQGFVSHGDGLIRWAAHPDICIDVGGPLGALNGTFIKFGTCIGPNEDSSGQTFKFPSSSTKIRRQIHPNMCLDVANHSGVNGNRIQLWECLQDDADQVLTWEVDDSAPQQPTPAPVFEPPAPSPATAAPRPAPAAWRSPVPAPTPPPSLPFSASRNYDCQSGGGLLARQDWSYRRKLWCCKHTKQGCNVRIPAWWIYDPVVPFAAHIREQPNVDGPRTSAMLQPSDVFRVSQGLEGSDGVLYLKLADGRGWFFDRMPGVGVMSVEYRTARVSTSQFSCAIWYTNIEQSWSDDHRRFCCQQAGRGCPAQNIRPQTTLILHQPIQTETNPPLHYEAFNCNAGYLDAERAWNPDKLSWCCLHRGIGCTTTTGLMPSALADSDCDKGGGWGWGWPWRQSGGCQPKRRGGRESFRQAFEWRRQPLLDGSGSALRVPLVAACCFGLLGAAVLLAKRLQNRLRPRELQQGGSLLEAVE